MLNYGVPPYITIEESDLAFTAGSESGTIQPDLIDCVQRTNDLLVGIIFFLGLIFGAIGMCIFWNRFKGD